MRLRLAFALALCAVPLAGCVTGTSNEAVVCDDTATPNCGDNGVTVTLDNSQ